MIAGGLAAMAVISNGIWGIILFVGLFIPQSIFYGTAYTLWCGIDMGNVYNGNKKESYLGIVLIIVLFVIGCICEAYVNPILIKNIIKI